MTKETKDQITEAWKESIRAGCLLEGHSDLRANLAFKHIELIQKILELALVGEISKEE